MTATATVPRSAGNGAALVVVALGAAISALESLEKSLFRARPAAAPAAPLAAPSGKDGLWQLYRLTGSSDSVSPRAAAYLRDHC